MHWQLRECVLLLFGEEERRDSMAAKLLKPMGYVVFAPGKVQVISMRGWRRL